MSLWVDKYRPNTLAKLSLHGDVTAKLTALARSEELPHLLFYGPSGESDANSQNAFFVVTVT